MFETFQIDSLSFHKLIVSPAFADLAPDTAQGYTGYLNEFTLMDDVSSSRPIVDIKRAQNIMQRRDASCDIIYKKVFGASTRKITTDEVYGATQFCRNEFYQGALKDWRGKDPLFGKRILPYFQKAMSIDLVTNSYFGDVDRVTAVAANFSTGVYDGVFKWLKKYQGLGVIPAAQTIAIADGTDYTGTPANAYNLLNAMYNKIPVLMWAQFTKADLSFYVSHEILEGYRAYLVATSTSNGNITLLQNGLEVVKFNGIQVQEQPLWTPVITEIKGGTAGYAAVLTVKGNFVFATDKSYGEGEDGKTALEVWYEKKDMTWYYRLFLKAGTNVALPEMVVYAISSWT
jgi:hypothetical protein